jgi:hypothetical protein
MRSRRSKQSDNNEGQVKVTRAVANVFAGITALACVLHAICSRAADTPDELNVFLSQRLTIATALAEPIAVCVARKDTDHPAFHGCIDWHSAVHGVWALSAYTRASSDRRYQSLIKRVLNPRRLAQERNYLAQHPDFEMPYGRSWFLRLAIDHQRAFRTELLTPFADEVAQSLIVHYTRTAPDPLSVAYDNASWALINLHDYGVARHDRRVVEFVKTKVRAHYLTDSPCPLRRVELDRREFMAVCTNWAWLVQLVLPQNEFRAWLDRFLPADLPLQPITKPRSAHEVGLNFSRAWGLWRLYSATGDKRYSTLYLGHFGETYNDSNLWKGDYDSVAHWVAQFGMFALMTSYDESLIRK